MRALAGRRLVAEGARTLALPAATVQTCVPAPSACAIAAQAGARSRWASSSLVGRGVVGRLTGRRPALEGGETIVIAGSERRCCSGSRRGEPGGARRRGHVGRRTRVRDALGRRADDEMAVTDSHSRTPPAAPRDPPGGPSSLSSPGMRRRSRRPSPAMSYFRRVDPRSSDGISRPARRTHRRRVRAAAIHAGLDRLEHRPRRRRRSTAPCPRRLCTPRAFATVAGRRPTARQVMIGLSSMESSVEICSPFAHRSHARPGRSTEPTQRAARATSPAARSRTSRSATTRACDREASCADEMRPAFIGPDRSPEVHERRRAGERARLRRQHDRRRRARPRAGQGRRGEHGREALGIGAASCGLSGMSAWVDDHAIPRGSMVNRPGRQRRVSGPRIGVANGGADLELDLRQATTRRVAAEPARISCDTGRHHRPPRHRVRPIAPPRPLELAMALRHSTRRLALSSLTVACSPGLSTRRPARGRVQSMRRSMRGRRWSSPPRAKVWALLTGFSRVAVVAGSPRYRTRRAGLTARPSCWKTGDTGSPRRSRSSAFDEGAGDGPARRRSRRRSTSGAYVAARLDDASRRRRRWTARFPLPGTTARARPRHGSIAREPHGGGGSANRAST